MCFTVTARRYLRTGMWTNRTRLRCVIELDGQSGGKGGIASFIGKAKQHRIWDREKLVRPPR